MNRNRRGPGRIGRSFAVIVALFGSWGCRKSTSSPTPADGAPSAKTAAPYTSAGIAPAASADSDAAAKAPTTDTPKTRLQAVAQQAVAQEEFEKLVEENAWSVYDPGTVGCQFAGENVRLDKPADAVREFDRAKHRASLVDRLVVMRGGQDAVKPDDSAAGALSLYDHALGAFTLTLRFVDSKWPALGGSPTIRVDKELSDVEDVFVADRGGGYVITTPQRVPFYVFGTSVSFKVKVDTETAKTWTQDGVALRYAVVQRFKKLGFHKDCRRVCKRVDKSTVDCPDDPENQGLGQFFVTEPVGHEIYLAGKLVSERQPPDGIVQMPVGEEMAPTPEGAAKQPESVPPKVAPTAAGRPAAPPQKAKADRAKCLAACVAGCSNDANCERSCAVQKCVR
ncbi:MAG: hypothetical protein IT348_11120 [Candidatus Eisenbacteria bacterium]|nr:hypothetical protein [Candidatus Eisenbacteria bacterium]